MPTTPNMSLLLPVPTVTPGPTYASENNTAFTVVDSHDHTSGKGVPVPSAGLNINADLTFNSHNATTLRSTQLFNNPSPLSLPADITTVYVSGGNLWYNNQIGQQVQITSGAALNASSIGGIGGDYVGSGALEFYTSASKTFTFWSSTNTPANLDAGSITIRPVLLAAKGITINAPLSLAANYSMTLPGANPSTTSFLTLDSSGNIAAPFYFDNSTLYVASNLLQIKPQGVTQGLLAPRSTGTTVGVGGVAISNTVTAGPFTGNNTLTGFNITITTTGRPVVLKLMGTPGSTSGAYLNFAGPSVNGKLEFANGGVAVSSNNTISPDTITLPACAFSGLDMSVNGVPGTYTYNIAIGVPSGSLTFNDCVLVAYEM